MLEENREREKWGKREGIEEKRRGDEERCTQVFGLLGGEGGELSSELFQVQTCHFLIQFL